MSNAGGAVRAGGEDLACERALRHSVIFRKVTGGFRAEWGAKVYAATVVSTGRQFGLPALGALRAALTGDTIMPADCALWG